MRASHSLLGSGVAAPELHDPGAVSHGLFVTREKDGRDTREVLVLYVCTYIYYVHVHVYVQYVSTMYIIMYKNVMYIHVYSQGDVHPSIYNSYITNSYITNQEIKVFLPQSSINAVVCHAPLVEGVDERGIVLTGHNMGNVATVGIQSGRG